MNNQLTLQDRINMVDFAQGRRFRLLRGEAREIAIEGITRHFRACALVGCSPDRVALREIIDDAINGRRVFAESENDTADVSRSLFIIWDGD